jgi:hypothetical protein
MKNVVNEIIGVITNDINNFDELDDVPVVEEKLNTGPIGSNGNGCLAPFLVLLGLGGLLEFLTGLFSNLF